MSDSDKMAKLLLSNPSESTLFWGFDGPTKAPPGLTNVETASIRDPHAFVLQNVNETTAWRTLHGIWLADALYSLAEAMGVMRVDYPEISASMPRNSSLSLTTDDIIDRLNIFLNVTLQFPNPFPGELGLPSRRGIISFRAIQALYQAWRISRLADGNKNYRVLEIGGGLGRTAYFSHVLGINKYTIIDIPLSNVAQAAFLGRAIRSDCISLTGENEDTSVRIIPTYLLKELDSGFDLIVNVDSFPEMELKSFREYYDFARDRKIPILSINHEYNHVTFRSIYIDDPKARATRHPYWMRRGYVEELVRWRVQPRSIYGEFVSRIFCKVELG